MVKPHKNPEVLITYCGRMIVEGVGLPTLDIYSLDKIKPYFSPLLPYTGDTTIFNGVLDVGDVVIKREPLLTVGGFREEKDFIGYCSDMKLIDDILKRFPNGKMVLVPKRLHWYFLDHGAKVKNMTIRKLEEREKKGVSDEEQQWKF